MAAAASWKIAISRLRFNRLWRNLARWCISNLLTVPTVKNLKFYKSGCHLENQKIAISQPRFERFWQNLAWWCSFTLLTVPAVKSLKFQKSKMAAAAILKNRHISAAVWPILTKSGTVTQFGPRDCLARYRDLKKSKMPAAGILTI